MQKVSILIIFAIALLTSFPANGNQATNKAFQGSQKNCSYSIEIETSCAPSAETIDHVSVRFSDSQGDWIIVKHLKNPTNGKKKLYVGFGRCAIDMFEASGPCMREKVCSLYLKKVGSDDWRPGWVKVHQQDGNGVVKESYMFYFRVFVPENVWYGFNYCHSKGYFYMPHVGSFGED
ncbi:embryo-specific protein ATS3A [Ziziphus jujuba]|uniref:Embryo-specific protein ATS3A n=1 Tax=Ziziphus jujuba TaxID=326968 RepID=A0A6P3ZGC5_ZIZJJ|nr:embryo-specific protein ATS3A [Ziziphus jujuba]